jgi:protein tyrosine phosphatase
VWNYRVLVPSRAPTPRHLIHEVDNKKNVCVCGCGCGCVGVFVLCESLFRSGLMQVAGAKQGASALDITCNVVKAAKLKKQRQPMLPLKDLVAASISEYNEHVKHDWEC